MRPCRKPCSAADWHLALNLLRQVGDGLGQRARGGRFDQPARFVAADRVAGELLGLRGAGAEEDRAPGGDPDRDPDLAEGVVDPRRHAAALLRHDAEGDVGDHRVEQADADAADDEAEQQRRPLGVDAEAAHQQQADPGQGQAGAHQPAGLDLGQRHPASGATMKEASVIGR